MFSHKIGDKTKVSTFTRPTQHSKVLVSAVRQERERKTCRLERKKNCLIHRQHDVYIENPEESTKKAIIINKFNNVTENKIIIQKSTIFLYATN